MTLIKSISGIRGTIGGSVDLGLTPIDIVKFTTGYAAWLQGYRNKSRCKVVVGRDARMSGEMVSELVIGTLLGCGCDVVNIGLASTPTTEIAVTGEDADGGIILTASHNPKQWNALKLLNERGEFLNKAEGECMLVLAQSEYDYALIESIGHCVEKDYTDIHIQQVLDLALVDVEAIKKAHFSVVCDGINSVGGIIIPRLLQALGVETIEKLNCDPTGDFAHTPEPIPQNLTAMTQAMKDTSAHVGFVVDPDVDRLAIVCEDGEMFGEEYTLVSVSDYVLSHTPGNTVSNMSSTRALSDVTVKQGGHYEASAVGEVNVVSKMKASHAIIGGEGNGGVIYPESHYGRDALVGIALFLSNLAHKGLTVSELRKTYPNYYISKNRIDLTPLMDVEGILEVIKGSYKNFPVNTLDGVKIDFPQGWVHLRRSNTEPIIRIYSEAPTMEQADNFASAVKDEFTRIAQSIRP